MTWRAWDSWGKRLVRALLPWPVLARCEAVYFAWFGEIELRLVRHLCHPDRDSIDVGANIGTYLHAMTRHSRRVIAFEPVPWLAPQLAKRFGRRVVVENLALSCDARSELLHIPVVDGAPVAGLSTLSPNGVAADAWKIAVQKRCLDDIYSDDVGFIKIDVEGHELRVLEGARRTIERCLPRVLVETEERHAPGTVQRVRDLFAALGYRGYFVLQRRLEPIARFDPATMQRSEDIAQYTPATPRRRFDRYVNNFLFLPPREPDATLERLREALA